MTQKLRVHIEPRHIAGANHGSATNCPIARALSEARPGYWQVWGPVRGRRRGTASYTPSVHVPLENAETWELSRTACAFIRAFDAHKETLDPLTIELVRYAR